MKKTAPQTASPALVVAITLAGVAAAGVLLWHVGPLLALGDWHPLESAGVRWTLIGLIAAAALAVLVWRIARAARNDRGLIAGLTQRAANEPSNVTAGDVAAIGERFERALASLKRRRGSARGGRYLYELPWYILIGAPGSGKTTALINSGLDLRADDPSAVRGVGGTRNCEWWFTGEAVLIDTAGRFTTQDSDREADRTAWAGFLALLLKHRPQRPINGAIVAVSASELLLADAAKRAEHAKSLRERVDELRTQLGIRFPIYVMVTKTDLVAGFDEMFADYDRARREQVWGITLPYGDTSPAPCVAALATELAGLERRLNDIVIDRLRPDVDPARRAAIYSFPQQWRVLKDALVELLREAFTPALAEEAPLVRGVYFTSGTQEGTPIDRALGGAARALGLAGRVAGNRGTGKSFFLTRLLREVVFREAGLAGTNLRWERRRALLQWSAIGVTVVLVGTALALWVQSYRVNQAHIASVAARLDAIERDAAALRTREASDPSAVLPVLQAVYALGAPESAAPARGTLGLDHATPLAAGAQDAYRALLKDAFLPRIAARLEARLTDGESTAARDKPAAPRTELVYEALKAYLMLFGGRNFDRTALRAYLLADWSATPLADAERARLRFHLDQLLAGGEVGAPAQADARVIANARGVVSRVPLRDRAYYRLTRLEATGSASTVEPPPFTIAAAAGASAQAFFGESTTASVPGLYTHAGYHRGVRERLQSVTRELAREESWVLGADTAKSVDPAAAERIAAELEARYFADYASAWERYLAVITLPPPASLAATAETARTLARPDSPLVALLTAIGKETTLGTPEAAAVDERFRELRQLVAGRPAPIQDALALLDKLGIHLNAAEDAVKRRVALAPNNVIAELTVLADRMPAPLRGILRELASASSMQLAALRRGAVTQAFATNLVPACTQTIAGRYPLGSRKAIERGTTEMSRDEFVRAFGAGGLLDGFFQSHLGPLVDTAGERWAFRGAEAAEMFQGTDANSALLAFQRARVIRDAFFRDGGRTLGARLEFRAIALDPGITTLTIELDGEPMTFSNTARGPYVVQWPGTRGVRLAVAPAAANAEFVFEGPWGLLRLLDRARVEAGPTPNAHQVTLDIEGRRARFAIQALGSPSPLRLSALEQFECPRKL